MNFLKHIILTYNIKDFLDIYKYILIIVPISLICFIIIDFFYKDNLRIKKRIVYITILLIPWLFINMIIMIIPNDTKTTINIKYEEINNIPKDSQEKINHDISIKEQEKIKKYLNIPSGSSLNKYLTTNNKTINYYQIVSKNPTYDMPLIIYLHGDGETYNIKSIPNLPIYKYILNEYINNPFIFIAPHTTKRDWISTSVTTNLKELIDYVINTYHIDKSKVIIIGASRGSMGVWNMISIYGDFFSSACPISWHPTTNLNYNNLVKVPIYAISGNSQYPENEVNKKMTEVVNRINELGGSAIMKTYNGETHDTIASALSSKEIFDYLLEK